MMGGRPSGTISREDVVPADFVGFFAFMERLLRDDVRDRLIPFSVCAAGHLERGVFVDKRGAIMTPHAAMPAAGNSRDATSSMVMREVLALSRWSPRAHTRDPSTCAFEIFESVGPLLLRCRQ